MIPGPFEHLGMTIPAPRWAITAWLLAPRRSIGPEGDAELRQSLARRLSAVIMSALVTSLISIVAVSRHPIPALFWMVPDLALTLIRVPLVVYMIRFIAREKRQRLFEPWIVDLFVCAGTLWSALLGLGTMLCLATSDPGLSILAILAAMGTIGAQGVRSPGSPRLNIVQMCVIVVPTAIGAQISSIPLTGWTSVLVPLYLLGMINVTYRLHEDYAAMIVTRIENWHHAMHCPLTALPNRPNFEARLTGALDAARAPKTPVALLCLDLDGFKAVNDALGHPAGDRLLEQVADRLRDLYGPTAPARLGGDEFAVVLPGCSAAGAEASASLLIAALSQPYELDSGSPVRIGVSVGIAVGDPGTDPASLVARADRALYAAKHAGRGTFRRHGADGEPAGPCPSGERRAIADRGRASQGALGAAA